MASNKISKEKAMEIADKILSKANSAIHVKVSLAIITSALTGSEDIDSQCEILLGLGRECYEMGMTDAFKAMETIDVVPKEGSNEG